MRLAVVDNDGLVQLRREAKLRGKQRFLLVFSRVVPIIVQPDLSYRDALGMPRESGNFVHAVHRHLVQLLRVQPDGGIHKAVPLRKRERCAAALRVAAGIKDKLRSLCVRRAQQSIAIRVKRLVVIVGMGVKIHGATSRFVFYNNIVVLYPSAAKNANADSKRGRAGSGAPSARCGVMGLW